MRSKIEKIVIHFVENLHMRIFGHPIGPEMKIFLGNLVWSFFGGVVISVVALMINIFAGRLLGPSEFGKYSLALVIGEYLLILFFLGFDTASLRAVAKSKNSRDVKHNISSASYFVFSSMIIFSTLGVLFSEYVAKVFSTDSSVVIFAIFLAAATGLKLLFNGFIQGIHQFKHQFIGKVAEAIMLVAIFSLIFFYMHSYTFGSYIIVIISGALALIFIFYLKLRGNFSSFDKLILLKQFSYGKLFLLSTALGTIFASVDKLAINRFLDVSQLGIYMAYYLVSIGLISQLSQMFNNVFIPTIAKSLNKAIFCKLNRLIYLSAIPLTLLIIAIVYVAMIFFGKKYNVVLNLVVCFGIFASLKLLLSTYNSIIITLSRPIYRKYIINYNIVNVLTVLIYIPLIFAHVISIQSIIIVQILNTFALVSIQKLIIKSAVETQARQLTLRK